MSTAKWLLRHTSRLKFRNRLEELNAKYGPAPEVPLEPWLDHYPQTRQEWLALGIQPPASAPPERRPSASPEASASVWERQPWC